MDAKLCFLAVLFVAIIVEGSAKPGEMKPRPRPGGRPGQGTGIPPGLVEKVLEELEISDLLNQIRTLSDMIADGGFEDSQALADILSDIFDLAANIRDLLDIDESSEETTEETTDSSTQPTPTAQTTASEGTTGEPSTESTQPTTGGTTDGGNKRLLQLRRDLIRSMLLRKLKGHK